MIKYNSRNRGIAFVNSIQSNEQLKINNELKKVLYFF